MEGEDQGIEGDQGRGSGDLENGDDGERRQEGRVGGGMRRRGDRKEK